jgi:hypothetical protein
MSAVGGVDADALPASEKLSPAAPSTFTAVVLLRRFCVEALTRRMAASSPLVNALGVASLRSAKGARKINLRVIK